MTETERIADQLERAFTGPAWHGPAVLEVLDGITAARAVARPIAAAHSIWEIVHHMEAWQRAVLLRLTGASRADLQGADDWPPVTDTGDAAWSATVERLKATHAELRGAIQAVDAARLDEPILPEMSSTYVTLQGEVQHNLYHAGQIAVLKKG